MLINENHLARCADLKVNNFDEGFTNCDIAKAIVDHFAAENMKVLSIQQRANKIARVTFDSKLVSEIVQLRGELDIGGVKVGVVPPPLLLPQTGLMLLCIICRLMRPTVI